MSNTIKSRSTKIGIPDHRQSHIEQEIQYGVVWPDGTFTWQEIIRGSGMAAIAIAAIAPGADTSGVNENSLKWSPQYWEGLLAQRAEAAKMDVDEYRHMHRFIKRTVILSVTATEEV